MAAGFIMRQVDIDATTKEVVYEAEVEIPDTPLDKLGALATLLAVSGLATVEDAANAAGLRPEDLIVEAQSWAVAQELNNAD